MVRGLATFLIIDAANVVGARPDGWWRDRATGVRRLHAGLVRLVSAGGLAGRDRPGGAGEVEPAGGAGASRVPVLLVVEGSARAGLPAGRTAAGIEVVHATGSGDDEVIAQVRAAPRPVLVVTADRLLRARVTAAGADVAGPGWLWARIDTTPG